MDHILGSKLAATHNQAIGVAVRACEKILERFPYTEDPALVSYVEAIKDHQKSLERILEELQCKTEGRRV